MANLCGSYYVVTGDETELRDLYLKMLSLETEDPEYDDFGDFVKNSCYSLAKILGKNNPNFDCRGEWEDLKLTKENDTFLLSFYIESAWSELSDWRRFVNSKYPNLSFFFTSEEYGSDIFETNDTEHKYFVEKYRLYIDGDNEYFKFNEQDEIVKRVNESTDFNVKTFDECLDLAITLDREDPNYFEIRVIDYVD